MRKVDVPCFAGAPISIRLKDDRGWRPRCSLELCHEGDHESYVKHDLDRKRICTWPTETNREALEALVQLDQELADL